MPISKIKIVSDACCKIPNAHIRGRANKGYAACGYMFTNMDDQIIQEGGKYLGELTVPQAEYQGLIFALDKAAGICRSEVEVWMDSEFVVRQLNGDYGLKSDNMKPLFDKVRILERRFKSVKYFHHPRYTPLAKRADYLANQELLKYRS